MKHSKYILLSAIGALILVGLPKTGTAADAKKGEGLFTDHACVGCHAIGNTGTATTGPNLVGVTTRRSESWLKKWIEHPDQMMADPVILGLLAKYPTPMPNMGLSDTEADDLIAYLKSKDTAKH